MAYTKVAIPKDLAVKIRSLIENSNLGYRSVQEFVIDATRRRLEELDKIQLQRKQIEQYNKKKEEGKL